MSDERVEALLTALQKIAHGPYETEYEYERFEECQHVAREALAGAPPSHSTEPGIPDVQAVLAIGRGSVSTEPASDLRQQMHDMEAGLARELNERAREVHELRALLDELIPDWRERRAGALSQGAPEPSEEDFKALAGAAIMRPEGGPGRGATMTDSRVEGLLRALRKVWYIEGIHEHPERMAWFLARALAAPLPEPASEPLELSLKPPAGTPERDAITRVSIPMTEYRDLVQRAGSLSQGAPEQELKPILREILDAFVALFREFQSEAFEWRAGEKRPCSESIAHVATLIGKLGDCHAGAAPAVSRGPGPQPHDGDCTCSVCVARHREPVGCPTPGACSCPWTSAHRHDG